jgi:hypothetical protein
MMWRCLTIAGLIAISGQGGNAQTTVLAIEPAIGNIGVDSTAEVRVTIRDVTSLHAYAIRITYDPAIIRCATVKGLQFFGSSSFLYQQIDSINGWVRVEEALLGPTGRSGSGDLVEIRFSGRITGNTQLLFITSDLRDTLNNTILVQVTGAEIRVGPVSGVAFAGQGAESVTKVDNFPNPFNSSTRIILSGLPRGNATLRVVSLLGAEVLSRDLFGNGGGILSVDWDGRDVRGTPASTGVYMIRVDSPSGVYTRKILLLK